MRAVPLLLLALASGALQGCAPVAAVGVGAGVMIAQDRRASETIFDDRKIESRAAEQIDKQINSVRHINVTSFDYHVLISGEVPDESTKTQVEKIVSGIETVRGVNNELVVGPISSLVSRSNDALITSNVKLRFVNNKDFSADHVKVVTENGTVYLMGLVKHSEAAAAAESASTTQGVQRVVKLFEYIDQ
ncbi:MAG: BON domain-containing protein [Gallionella sp.]